MLISPYSGGMRRRLLDYGLRAPQYRAGTSKPQPLDHALLDEAPHSSVVALFGVRLLASTNRTDGMHQLCWELVGSGAFVVMGVRSRQAGLSNGG